MTSAAPFSDDERALIGETADALVRRRMALPAMMFLEVLSPLNVVSASMLHVLTPLWRVVLPAARLERVARLLERRDAIPALVAAIDAAEEQRRRLALAEHPSQPPRRGGRAPTSPGSQT